MSHADNRSVPRRACRSLLRRLSAVLTAGALAAGTLTAGLVAGTTAPAAAVPAKPNDVAAMMFQWTWNSIAKECTTNLGPAGYGYVQISPPNEHVRGGQWWTSYQPVSYKIESKLGTRTEFKAMVDTCKAAGVDIIADVVINHMSGSGGGTGWAGTSFSSENYPGPDGAFSPQDFNDCRENIADSDYGNNRWRVQNCRLVGLQDLKTGSEYVRQEIANYLNDLVSLGVRGFRVDAAKHIPAGDLEAIMAKVTDKSVYVVHEVIGSSNEPIKPDEYLGSGDSHEFNYARHLRTVFNGGSLSSLEGLRTANWLLPSDRAGVFVDNHDTERNGETMNYKYGQTYKLANVFMLAYPYGWPTVYSGYTWSDKDAGAPQQGNGEVVDADCANSATWTCAHRWPETANMVGFHNAVKGTSVAHWVGEGNKIAFSRGNKGFVAINRDSGSWSREFTTSLPDGSYCNVVSSSYQNGTCPDPVRVAGGKVSVNLGGNSAFAIYQGVQPPTCSSDTQAPSVPGNVQGTAAGTSVSLSWTASTDNNSVTGYRITRTGGAGTVELTSTGTTLTDSGLLPQTAYSYTVRAVDCNDNVSGASAARSVRTGDKSPGTTVYYATDKSWSAYYVHYRVGTGAWTTAPGEKLAPACAGWVSREIANDAGAAITAVFTNGSGVWDNNGTKDYALTGTVAAVKGGSVSTTRPCPDDPEPPAGPGLPTGLTVTASGTTVDVSWKAPAGGSAASYTVVRAGGTGTVTRTVTGTSVKDTGLVADTTYWYKIRAVSADGRTGEYTAVVSTKTGREQTAPGVPTDLKVAVSGTTLTATWKAPASGAAKYTLVRAGGAGTVTRVVTGTSVADTGLLPNTAYRYKVRALDADGRAGEYTAVVTVTSGSAGGGGDVTAPSTLTVTVSGTTATVSWKAPAQGAVKHYVLVRAGGAGTLTRTVSAPEVSGDGLSVSGLTLTDRGLQAGKTYWYKVKAVDPTGKDSDFTEVVSVKAS